MDPAEELTTKLEKIFGKRVISIMYNPEKKEGVQEGDEICIVSALEKEDSFEKLGRCVVVLNGSGGDFKTALLISYLLRKKISYYTCFVPTVAGSSLCYLILHSNKLMFGQNSLLTQIDPIFEHEGESYRAIKRLDDQNKEIRDKAHDVFNYVFGQLNRLLSHKYSLLNLKKVELGDLSPIIYMFMGKDYHEDGVRYEELKKLNINLELVSEDTIQIGKKLINECRNKLFEEDKRLIVQTKHGSYVLIN